MKFNRSSKGYEPELVFDQHEIFKYFEIEWQLFKFDIMDHNKSLQNKVINFFLSKEKRLWALVPDTGAYYYFDDSVRRWSEEKFTEEL